MVMRTNDPIYEARDREIDWAYENIQWPKCVDLRLKLTH